jgi:phosphopantothenoylcysteine decarboxylase/phosphopantothenate--cysteine ligase
MFQGKKVVLGVTGGIAAYKAAELTRELVKGGASVKVVMTRSACRFVSPLTFETLSRNPVYRDLFTRAADYRVEHIALAEEAEATIVAPATANILGKVAAGIADDLLSTYIMATKTPVVLAPALNVHMWENQVVQENVARLRGRGYVLVEPAQGELACGTEGAGRLAPLEDIIEALAGVFSRQDLAGVTLLVTAGPTREPLDQVRFLGNHSSGKMGYALARVARRRGARVILVAGPNNLSPPPGITLIEVKTALEMQAAVLDHFEAASVVIKAAAVADYRPANPVAGKIKKTGEALSLPLLPNPDILADLGQRKTSQILVGFAMETGDLIRQAGEKLKRKNLDLIVANDLSLEGAGFAVDTNIVSLLYRDGRRVDLPRMNKLSVAEAILDSVRELVNGR